MARPAKVKKGPYIRLFCGYFTDARVLGVGAEAELVWLRSIAWSKDNRLDGAIPEYALPALMGKCHHPPSVIADELTGAGLWLANGTGWHIPPDKWVGYQITDERAEEIRADARDRAARYRAKQAETNGR
jgi:hypothetical protein